MQSSIRTMAFNGIDTIPVDVQVHLSNGMPSIAIVGLADKAVAESKERVRAALSSIGVVLPQNGLPSIWPRLISIKKAHIMICPSLWG